MGSSGSFAFVEGDDAGSDEGRGEEQADDFERDGEAMHEGVADLLHGGSGLWGWCLRVNAVEEGPGEESEDEDGDDDSADG